MELMKASEQWSSRPNDQRFWNVSELYAAVNAHRAAARTGTVNIGDMQVQAIDNDIQIVGKTGTFAKLTSWAFGQLAARAKAPAAYLRSLKAETAVTCLNEGLQGNTDTAKVLLHENGGYFCRAVTSEKYTRIWNEDIVSRLLGFEAEGWRVPPAYAIGSQDYDISNPESLVAANVRLATAEDAKLSLTIKEGTPISPSGLYASFEDMFAFMVHPDKVVKDGSTDGLMRGFLVWNSEVGKATFGVQTFYFRGVCGNHIIWGATDVKEIRLRHVGNADDRAFAGLSVELKKYAEESATDIEDKIKIAKNFVLKHKTADELVDFIFAQRILTRKDALAAYQAVVPDEDGAPYTAWGFAQGITRLSQQSANADDRVSLDRAAGKVIDMAF